MFAIRQIDAATSFEAMTGRRRGHAANAVTRKGAIMDWIGELNGDMKQRSSAIAGPMLERFGYTPTARICEAFPGRK